MCNVGGGTRTKFGREELFGNHTTLMKMMLQLIFDPDHVIVMDVILPTKDVSGISK
jgi:hypothetical protein